MNNDDRESMCNLLDEYLTYLYCSDRPLTAWDGAYLLTTQSADLSNSSNPISYLGAEPADFIGGQWKIKILGNNRMDERILPGFMLQELSSMHWSDVARNPKLAAARDRHNVDVLARNAIAQVSPKGVVSSDTFYVGYKSSKWYHVYDPRSRFVIGGVEEYRGKVKHAQSLQVMLGVAYMEPAFWVAKVRLNGTPSVSLITDPTGIKELWKLRDKPETSDRRAALLHWVAEHWRKNRHDPDVESFVRKSLRGARELVQGDLRVEIQESKEDATAKLMAIHEREKMRKSGRDRRRRSRT